MNYASILNLYFQSDKVFLEMQIGCTHNVMGILKAQIK